MEKEKERDKEKGTTRKRSFKDKQASFMDKLADIEDKLSKTRGCQMRIAIPRASAARCLPLHSPTAGSRLAPPVAPFDPISHVPFQRSRAHTRAHTHTLTLARRCACVPLNTHTPAASSLTDACIYVSPDTFVNADRGPVAGSGFSSRGRGRGRERAVKT